MKFLELLDQAIAMVPVYRQIIFRTIMITLVFGGQPGRISSIFRKFSEVIAGRGTLKQFYNNSICRCFKKSDPPQNSSMRNGSTPNPESEPLWWSNSPGFSIVSF